MIFWWRARRLAVFAGVVVVTAVLAMVSRGVVVRFPTMLGSGTLGEILVPQLLALPVALAWVLCRHRSVSVHEAASRRRRYLAALDTTVLVAVAVLMAAASPWVSTGYLRNLLVLLGAVLIAEAAGLGENSFLPPAVILIGSMLAGFREGEERVQAWAIVVAPDQDTWWPLVVGIFVLGVLARLGRSLVR